MEFTSPPPTRPDRLVERRALPARPAYGTLDIRAPGAPTARVIPADDRRWALEGTTAPALVGEIVAAPTLTVAEIELSSGQRTDRLVRSGAETLYVLDGTVGVELPEAGTWLEAGPRDGVYLPAGTPHRLLNVGAGSASVVFQVVG
jgi:quercetin dioxygenase-like cupin family protein